MKHWILTFVLIMTCFPVFSTNHTFKIIFSYETISEYLCALGAIARIRQELRQPSSLREERSNTSVVVYFTITNENSEQIRTIDNLIRGEEGEIRCLSGVCESQHAQRR